ncbi:hypothetical protein ACE10Z_27100 [Bradyrhizobium sp. Pha-3]|uniref:hypothetical protein n=1 Tax=Bradyrhizobium sp. Pha-3 TaxID=208375 RepID=UPI0035D4BE77
MALLTRVSPLARTVWWAARAKLYGFDRIEKISRKNPAAESAADDFAAVFMTADRLCCSCRDGDARVEAARMFVTLQL